MGATQSSGGGKWPVKHMPSSKFKAMPTKDANVDTATFGAGASFPSVPCPLPHHPRVRPTPRRRRQPHSPSMTPRAVVHAQRTHLFSLINPFTTLLPVTARTAPPPRNLPLNFFTSSRLRRPSPDGRRLLLGHGEVVREGHERGEARVGDRDQRGFHGSSRV